MDDFRTSFVREPSSLRHHPALVLNADYRPLSYYPLSLWPWQEAVKAAFLDRVVVLAEYDEFVRSPTTRFRIPSVVVLRDYVQPQRRVAFTRFNLFLRDEFHCQYCGAKGDLTFDHVVPRARGGVTAWENVVAACASCNLKKGSRSLKQVGFTLRRPRGAPARRSCATSGASFPPTTCTTAGWTSSTGTPSSRPEGASSSRRGPRSGPSSSPTNPAPPPSWPRSGRRSAPRSAPAADRRPGRGRRGP